MTLVITKCSLRKINPCNHDYPGMGRGLARSLFALVWGTSQLYKGTRFPRIQVVASGGQQCSGFYV
jgi:hypothetical protein